MGGKSIPLTQGLFAIVDEEDFDQLNLYKWYASKRSNGGYVAMRDERKRGVYHRHIYMHREIMKTPSDQMTDHRNGDGLNNQKCNLRNCSRKENQRNKRRMSSLNSSGVRGIFWEKSCNRWRAQISIDNKNKHLGVFKSKEDAQAVYIEASKSIYGEFSPYAGGV